jgi:RNA recognition motif-containing protein
MGRSKNSDKWLPATPLRIGAFARSLVPNSLAKQRGKNLNGEDIEAALLALRRPIEISHVTLDGWLKGEVEPSEGYVNLIQQQFPMSPDWLVPALEFSPIRRFLCALDIWGSRIDSPRRKLDLKSPEMTVGNGLATLAKRWASTPRVLSSDTLGCEFFIPRLRALVPNQISSTVYVSTNPLTLMEFMFRGGAYLEFSDEEFAEWAIDLASLTLIVGAFLEGINPAEKMQSGRTGDFNWLTYRIFFRGRGNWPNSKSVSEELKAFPELSNSAINYPARLMEAREVLRTELLSIACDLSIAEVLSKRIKDYGRMWQDDTHG